LGGIMRAKSSKLLIGLIFLLLASVTMTGCGKSGTRFNNTAPTIKITSYEGFDDSATYSSQDTLIFQQKIYWHANDPDGVIAGYAYRVLDAQDNPIATPGNAFIDTDGSITPPNVLNTHGSGWVIHYLPGADTTIPLSNPEARRSIWTSQKYAVINFPASDANGNPLPKLSTFEVIAIDNRGDVTANAAWRKFNSTSNRPECTVITTKGNPNGGAVGSGVKLSLSMRDSDPFVDPVPWYYEFKLQKLDMQDNVLETTDWIRTDSPNNPKLNEYLLTRDTTPALSYDFTNGTQVTKTRVLGRAYDLSGVVSDENQNSSKLLFAVKDGFKPKALIYGQKVHGVGDNHYLDYAYDDQKTPAEIMPFSVTNGKVRYAIPMFKDFNGKNTAVNSNNFKLWVRWGWHGEYGKVQSNGNIDYNDVTPYDKKVDTVLNYNVSNSTGNYYSEITHFDLRFNDQPYNFPPYATYIQVDNDGTRWLRIPLNSVLGQGIVLNNMPSGHHKFELRVVDLQNVPSDPVVYEFELVDPVPVASRTGILIVDDDAASNATSPEPFTTDYYNALFGDYSGTKTVVRLPDVNLDRRDRRLSFSDLQNYKMVVYHSDNIQSKGTLFQDCDAMVLYMQHDGNFMVSSSSQLSGMIGDMVTLNQQSFLNALGITYSTTSVASGGSLTTNPYFQIGKGQLGFGDVNLRLTAAGEGTDSWVNSIISARQGLGAITLFNNISGEAIFKYGCKPTTSTTFPPTQDQFNTLNDKTVGVRNINGAGRAYTIGFPLTYMQFSDSKAVINRILSECGLL